MLILIDVNCTFTLVAINYRDTVLLLYRKYSECDNKLMLYAFVDFDGNRTGHVNVLLLAGLRLLRSAWAVPGTKSLFPDDGGLILFALLAGGNYDGTGLKGCGGSIAQGLARAGFGDRLIDLVHAVSGRPAEYVQDALFQF